jgi:hypothetical protein
MMSVSPQAHINGASYRSRTETSETMGQNKSFLFKKFFSGIDHSEGTLTTPSYIREEKESDTFRQIIHRNTNNENLFTVT